ncbi:unnamed protein product [Bathycoccus prasinos]
MVRKYDRYGYNRQYKAKPLLEKHISAPPEFTKGDIDTAYGGNRKRSRADVEESQRRRRATNAARKLKYPHPLGANNYGWQRGDTKMVLMAAAAPFAPLAAPLLFESGAISKFARYRVRRQALRDARAMREAMEAVPEYDKPGLGLAGRMAKRFREGDELAIDTSSANDMVDYVVSKQIIGPETIHETDPTAVKTVGTGLIGPNVGNGTATYQTLDVLGFVVGQKPSDGGTAAAIGGSTEGNVNEYKNTFVILDQSGGSGKSVLSAICMSTYGMHCQGSGKREDLSYAFSSYFRENPNAREFV